MTKKEKSLTAQKAPSPKLELARILEAPPSEQEIDAPEIGGYELEETAGDLTPTVDFYRPGTYIYGEYLGSRTLKLGARFQIMYDLKRPDNGEIVSIWGSTILDNRMKRAGFEMGDGIFIQYLGNVDVATAGMNPAKNYRVGKVKAKQ